jgi:hypothetical protein
MTKTILLPLPIGPREPGRFGAYYAQGYFVDQAAVTVNEFGTGKGIYLGPVGDSQFDKDVFEWVSDKSQEITLNVVNMDLVTGRSISGTQNLQPYEFLILTGGN